MPNATTKAAAPILLFHIIAVLYMTEVLAAAPCSPDLPKRSSERSSDRLEAPVELHIDQHRIVALEPLCEEVGRILDRLRALRHDAKRAGKADEIDRRIEKLHTDIAVDL